MKFVIRGSEKVLSLAEVVDMVDYESDANDLEKMVVNEEQAFACDGDYVAIIRVA